MKRRPERGGIRAPLFRAVAITGSLLVSASSFADAPAWWAERGVLMPNSSAEDYALVNQGQLKDIATAAAAEMDEQLPSGAGDIVHTLTSTWTNRTAETNDFAPLNIGQLKSVAKPFYDRLIVVGFATGYPWSGGPNQPDDFAMANIGQVKNLFSFAPAAVDSDGNGLADAWEMRYFGQVGVDVNADADGDGLSNLEEYQKGINPTTDDTDGDGVTDDEEIQDGSDPTDPTSYPPRLRSFSRSLVYDFTTHGWNGQPYRQLRWIDDWTPNAQWSSEESTEPIPLTALGTILDAKDPYPSVVPRASAYATLGAGASSYFILGSIWHANVNQTSVCLYRYPAVASEARKAVFIITTHKIDGVSQANQASFETLVIPAGATTSNSISLTATLTHDWVGEGDNRTEDVGQSVVPIEVVKLWSDQLNGVTDANFLPNGTGQGDKPYLLMGASQSSNSDLKGHIKIALQDPVPSDLRSKVLWRLARAPGNATQPENGTSTYDSYGTIITMTVDVPTDDLTGYYLVGGYDQDGDAQLSASEVSIIPRYRWRHKNQNGIVVEEDHNYEIKIVSKPTYDDATERLTNLAAAWDLLRFVEASRLMIGFLSETCPSGASSIGTTIARDAEGLTHDVGILFDPPGNSGPSIAAIFAPESEMTAITLASTALNNWLQDKLSSADKVEEVHQRFAQSNNDIETFVWSLPESLPEGSFSFTYGVDTDLSLALGAVRISVTATVEVNRAFQVNSVRLTGEVADLYDFDYDLDGEIDPARVQSGYNTLGIAGRVIVNDIQLSDSIVPDFQMSF